jgi:hypothetical protein
MASALVQSANWSNASASSLVGGFGSTTTAGNMLLCWVYGQTVTGISLSVSDSVNGSWTQVGSTYSDATQLQTIGCFIFPNAASVPSSSTNVTVHLGSVAAYLRFRLQEYSSPTNTPVDQFGPGHSDVTTTAVSIGPTGTTAQAAELICALVATSNSVGGFTGLGSYTADPQNLNTVFNAFYLFDNSGPWAYTFAATLTNSTPWQGYIVTFKTTGGSLFNLQPWENQGGMQTILAL